MSRRTMPGQLDLFDPVTPAASDPERDRIAMTVPTTVRLGTSSWAFPGWAGIVYAERASEQTLARRGLEAYARRPFLRAVGLDRTYYAPLPAEALRAYAERVPDEFRFLVKAHRECTGGASSALPGAPRDLTRHLDVEYATREVVEPTVAGLGENLGALLFQFEPRAPADGGPRGFAESLHGFLAGLPRLPGTARYAVEIRNRLWLTPDYARALDETGAVHCHTVHPQMPSLEDQARVVGSAEGMAPLVVRWNLHAGLRYESAKGRYAPFDKLVDEDLPTRHSIGRLVAAAAANDREALVTINNKAEGSAPLSVRALVEELAARLAAPSDGDPT